MFFSHYYAKIKVDSYDSLPVEKKLKLHNVIILIKSGLHKDSPLLQYLYYYNQHYYNLFLENCLYQLAKK